MGFYAISAPVGWETCYLSSPCFGHGSISDLACAAQTCGWDIPCAFPSAHFFGFFALTLGCVLSFPLFGEVFTESFGKFGGPVKNL